MYIAFEYIFFYKTMQQNQIIHNAATKSCNSKLCKKKHAVLIAAMKSCPKNVATKSCDLNCRNKIIQSKMLQQNLNPNMLQQNHTILNI
mmetsp:Transcript_16969/g.25082  ORF Transcript_16969/g.25082 Transcript_16969/m.25082 type:complete len:89 (+) Transcript_16969:196-462(+)